MLMVGNMVLHNNAKMLKMGVFFMFVYDYGHQGALLDSKASSLDQDVPHYIHLLAFTLSPAAPASKMTKKLTNYSTV